MQQVALSAIGPDHPGIVDALTAAISEAGGNIADSRMINLRGQFAVVILVEAEDERMEDLCRRVSEQAREIGLTVQASSPSPTPAGVPAEGVPYRIRTYAMDQAGLVHRITHILHRHQVNIEELSTSLHRGAYTGTPVFNMEMVVSIPLDVALKDLRRELEGLCADLNCDLDIDPV
jgi:glycine cleavage system transcriptional repressor